MRTSGRSCLTENWLEDCGVESALLPDTMTMIPDHLFASCGRLRTVRLPARLELICQEGFQGGGFQCLAVQMSARKVWKGVWCPARTCPVSQLSSFCFEEAERCGRWGRTPSAARG